MWQAVKDTLSLLSVKFGGNQRHPTWGTITAKTQGELDLKGDEETGDQDNSGKVWRWQEDDWGKRGLCGGPGAERGAGAELGQEQGFLEAPSPQQEGCPTVGTAHYSGQIVHFAHCSHSTPNDHLKPVQSPFAGGDTGPRGHDHGHTVCKRQNLHNPGSTPNALVFFARRPIAHRRNSHS